MKTARTQLAVTTALALGLSACSGSDPSVAPDQESSAAVSTEENEGPATSQPAEPSTPGALEVTMEDGGFRGPMRTIVRAGTALSMTNASTSQEFHALLVVKLDEGDDRAATDLMSLPIDVTTTIGAGYHSLEGLGGEPVGTLSAPPGAPGRQTPNGASRLVLDEPGRYVLMDTLPVGTDVVEAISAENGGDFSDLQDGPFHHQEGELVVIEVVADEGAITTEPFGHSFFYGNFDEDLLLFAGSTAEELCHDEEPSAPAEVLSGSGSTELFLPEVATPIYVYASDLGAPELVDATCSALFDDDGGTQPLEPIAVGEGQATATVLIRPDGTERVMNRTVGRATADDGTTYELEGWADLEVVDGVPVGDPSEFQGLDVRIV